MAASATGVTHVLADAKQMADYIIDNMDPDWLIGFSIELFDPPGAQRAIPWVRNDWASNGSRQSGNICRI